MSYVTQEKLSSLSESLVSLESLSSRYDLSLEELRSLLSPLESALKIELLDIGGTLYVTPLHLALLDSLKGHLRNLDGLQRFLLNLENGALIYRCTVCGELLLTENVLSGTQLQHECSLHKVKTRIPTIYDLSLEATGKPTGQYELLASGPLDELLLWMHSLRLGLDNPLKGI